jgi:hypothetical protein
MAHTEKSVAATPGAQAVCGGNRFEVVVNNAGHPLYNVYRLYAQTGGKRADDRKLLYEADEGGWFNAACVEGRQGPMLLFQSYCGGSACVENKFGIVDARSLKVLLLPGNANVSNEKQAKAVLGREVPSLSDDKVSFCCDSEKSR